MTQKYKNLSAIVLAGGKGTRTNVGIPKQFIKISGKYVIEYSISSLSGMVDNVIVVVPDTKIWDKMGIKTSAKIIQGGDTRSKSLLNGLKAVRTPNVLIHDASRPLIPKDVVKNVAESLDKYVCAYPVLPVRSTIVVDSNGKLQDTPRRSDLREIQTPQGFQTSWLIKAMERFGDQHSHIPELIRLMGEDVKHIEGSPWLFKITYEPDIFTAESLINKYNLNG